MRIDDRFQIHPRQPEDTEELFALTDANRAYLREWLPWLDHCTSPDDTRKNILTSLEEADRGVSLALCIWYDGRIVGVTGFNTVNKANRIGHIGYWLGQEYSGQGIMTRAVRALTEHGFATLGLNRITIAAAVENGKSRAIAERLGFRLEGIERGAEWLYDHFVDHAVYAITRADWDALSAATSGIAGLRAHAYPSLNPMATHLATIRWQNSGPDILKREYSREHTWHFDGGLTVPASPSPHIVAAPWSNAASLDPEEAFVASVASCHMLWFLHVAVDAGFAALSYEDEAVGEMTRNEKGVLWISKINLKPVICWSGSRQPTTDVVANLHHLAHEQCFIASSIKSEVIITSP